MMKTKMTQKQVNTVMKKPIGSTGIHSTTAGSYEQGKKVLTSIETLTDKIHERTTITDTFSTESSGYFPIGKVVAMNLSTLRRVNMMICSIHIAMFMMLFNLQNPLLKSHCPERKLMIQKNLVKYIISLNLYIMGEAVNFISFVLFKQLSYCDFTIHGL